MRPAYTPIHSPCVLHTFCILDTFTGTPTGLTAPPTLSPPPQGSSGSLILLDDLPHTHDYDSRCRLSDALCLLAATARSPVVVITTEASGASGGGGGGEGGGNTATGSHKGLHKVGRVRMVVGEGGAGSGGQGVSVAHVLLSTNAWQEHRTPPHPLHTAHLCATQHQAMISYTMQAMISYQLYCAASVVNQNSTSQHNL